MKKKSSIRERINLWIRLHKSEIVPGVKLLVPLFLAIFIIQKIPSIIRDFELTKFDSETIGVIEVLNRKKGIQESQEGGKVVIQNYELDYSYLVDGELIENSEIISTKSISIEQMSYLNKLKQGDSILVKYNVENKRKSKLSF